MWKLLGSRRNRSHAGPSQKSFSAAPRTTTVAVLVTLSAAIGALPIIDREPVVPERTIANRPIQVPDDGYASSQTCKACHPGQYETWQRSYHRTMTQVATPETVVANFDGVQVGDVYGGPMRLER